MIGGACRLIAGVLAGLFITAAASAQSGPTYISGRLNNITFAHDYVMVMMDTGLPDNCVGTAFGWMKIPAANKPIIAFVTGLWLRGDTGTTVVTIYTDGLVEGYCRVSQIDPAG
jgi:hypothetical protein